MLITYFIKWLLNCQLKASSHKGQYFQAITTSHFINEIALQDQFSLITAFVTTQLTTQEQIESFNCDVKCNEYGLELPIRELKNIILRYIA